MSGVCLFQDSDYVAGILRSQIEIAQNLKASLENGGLDKDQLRNEFHLLSRLNRQIISCYQLQDWSLTGA